MRNFGLLKTIVENSLVENYKKNEFKVILREFKEFIKDHKAVGKLYTNYGSIMKMRSLTEDVAREFIELSINDIKSTIKENIRQFEEFDSWVETLDSINENNYELIDNLVFANLSHDFVKLVESKKELYKIITEAPKEESKLTENVNIPLESMFSVVADTFSNEYSNLNEAQLFELKSLLKMSKDELIEGIERLKNEVTKKLDSIEPSDEETKVKLQETKDRVINTNIDTLSYYKLKELSKGL